MSVIIKLPSVDNG